MNQGYFHYPLVRIGIIGGGQLARMMAQKAKKLGFHIVVLDLAPNCPAAQVGCEQIVGDFYDEQKITELVEKSDITTYDIEHINTKSLQRLVDEGNKIHPPPHLLEIIQDKSKQKEILTKFGIPTARWKKVEDDIASIVKEFGFPAVQKSCKGGYDGKGVLIIQDKKDIANAIKSKSFIEEFIDFEKELAIMVARSSEGEVKTYPVVEMVFDERANICDMVIAPARVDENIQKIASKIAINCVEALEGVGIFGIEMFLTKDGRVLVNEIAPRPHNSGHYTIEACVTCQFEQHVRAISGLPLGSTELLSAAVMINLLGEDGYEGFPIIEGLNKALSIPGLSFHFYGKKVTRPFRKMGHVTILDEDLQRAIEKAKKVKIFLKVKGINK